MLICCLTVLAALFSQVCAQEDCTDQLGEVQCRLLAFRDACRTRRAEMLLSCPNTCNLCTAGRSLPCYDINAASCSSYVVLGLCEQLKDTLENTCRLSCGWCTVGAWSAWGAWTRCSATCGLGSQIRKRKCGSQDCGIAPSQEARQCNVQSCNSDRYSPWTRWSSCSVTCGIGIRVRTRQCLNTFSVLFTSCSQLLREEQRCTQPQACPVYSWLNWSNWNACTRTCGQGVKTRRRNCNFGVTSNCGSVSVQNQFCNEFDCPVYSWLPWATWSACTLPCGRGVASRTRSCNIGSESNCGINWRETDFCNNFPCNTALPSWNPWTGWSECTKSCGSGFSYRSRSCSNGDPGSCGTEVSQSVACNEFACSVYSWLGWSNWSPCSKSCGRGVKTKRRNCNIGVTTNCGRFSVENQFCNDFLCPDFVVSWLEWKPWGGCDRPCGTGFRFRKRDCNTGNNADCGTFVQEAQVCNQHNCPAIQWNSWRGWGSCTHPCGGGTRSRSRVCSSGRPLDCGTTLGESEECNMHDCPDIQWNQWGPWTPCTRSCGDAGKKSRNRNCNTGRNADCGSEPTQQTWACNTDSCPFNYRWNEWVQWSPCTKRCGSGTRTRTRSCSTGRQTDCGTLWRQRWKCNTQKCRVGQWNAWNGWTTCSKTCGDGSRTRTRSCSTGRNSDCGSTSKETLPCNRFACPAWNNWNDWSSCSTSCGSGDRRRTRSCNTGNRRDCQGPSTNVESCTRVLCPVTTWLDWNSWSSCSKSCETGQMTRTRECSTGKTRDCGQANVESLPCNTQECPPVYSWGPWVSWSDCSRPCEGGTRTRTRVCSSGNILDCGQSSRETLPCNREPCPADYSWGEWSSWSSCAATCGESTKTRLRSCSSGNIQDCGETPVEILPCTEDPCPLGWTDWSEWSNCPVTCGNGTVYRLRSCLDNSCEGLTTESAICVLKPCPPPCECECEDKEGASCSDFKPYCSQIPTYATGYCPKTCDMCPECLCEEPACPDGETLRRNSTECCVINHNVTCGQNLMQDKMIEVEPGNQTVWPWMVYVRSGFLVCGGSLVHRRWVMSAAHCFDPIDLTNVTATVGGKYEETGSYSHTYRIQNIITHPNYRQNPLDGTIEHDIALLQLPEEVPISSYIQPICLSLSETDLSGQTCFATGWGVTQSTSLVESPHLNEVVMQVVTKEECNLSFPSLPGYVVCAKSNDTNANVCLVESGGPLMCQLCESCAWYVIGITSYGPSDCATPGEPGVYTRVAAYWYWIQAITGISTFANHVDKCN